MAVRQYELAPRAELALEDAGDEVSAEALWAEIDQKARQYFNLSGDDFARLYQQGALPNTFAVAELGFLLRCFNDRFIPA